MIPFLHPKPADRHGRISRILPDVLALVGAGIMVYLAALHFEGGGSSVCDISHVVSCSSVNRSIYSTFLGVPVAILGLIFFIGLIALRRFGPWRGRFDVSLILLSGGLAFSLVLSYSEVAILGMICALCEASKVIMAAILVLAAAGAQSSGERVSWPLIAASAASGLIAGIYMIFFA